MASFHPDYSSSKPLYQQWQAHLQRQAYVDDVTSSVNNVASSVINVERAIRVSVDEYNRRATELLAAVDDASEVFQAGADATIGAIEASAASIVGALEAETEAIHELGSLLDDSLTLLIDQQRIGNVISANIARLLKVPDFQKERLYYLEQGLKHYRNAALDTSLMDDALENLLKAEEREKTDYFVLHRIGIIYLYSATHIDPQRALDYFMRAARFAAVESSPNAVRLAKLLTGDVEQALDKQEDHPAAIQRLAAESFLEAAFASYLLGHYGDALAHTRRAEALAPDRLAMRVAEAKYLFLCESTADAITILEGAIGEDRHFAAVVASDPDLEQRPECLSLLTRLRSDARKRLVSLVASADASGAPFVAPGGSLHAQIAIMREGARNGNLLQALSALEYSADVEAQLSAWCLVAAQVELQKEAEVASVVAAQEIRLLHSALQEKHYARFKEMLRPYCTRQSDIMSVDIGSVVAQRVKAANQKRLAEEAESHRAREAQEFYDKALGELTIQNSKLSKNYNRAAALLREAVALGSTPASELLDWIERPYLHIRSLDYVLSDIRRRNQGSK